MLWHSIYDDNGGANMERLNKNFESVLGLDINDLENGQGRELFSSVKEIDPEEFKVLQGLADKEETLTLSFPYQEVHCLRVPERGAVYFYKYMENPYPEHDEDWKTYEVLFEIK